MQSFKIILLLVERPVEIRRAVFFNFMSYPSLNFGFFCRVYSSPFVTFNFATLKVKIKFALEQAIKTQRGRSSIVLLFL